MQGREVPGSSLMCSYISSQLSLWQFFKKRLKSFPVMSPNHQQYQITNTDFQTNNLFEAMICLVPALTITVATNFICRSRLKKNSIHDIKLLILHHFEC